MEQTLTPCGGGLQSSTRRPIGWRRCSTPFGITEVGTVPDDARAVLNR